MGPYIAHDNAAADAEPAILKTLSIGAILAFIALVSFTLAHIYKFGSPEWPFSQDTGTIINFAVTLPNAVITFVTLLLAGYYSRRISRRSARSWYAMAAATGIAMASLSVLMLSIALHSSVLEALGNAIAVTVVFATAASIMNMPFRSLTRSELAKLAVDICIGAVGTITSVLLLQVDYPPAASFRLDRPDALSLLLSPVMDCMVVWIMVLHWVRNPRMRNRPMVLVTLALLTYMVGDFAYTYRGLTDQHWQVNYSDLANSASALLLTFGGCAQIRLVLRSRNVVEEVPSDTHVSGTVEKASVMRQVLLYAPYISVAFAFILFLIHVVTTNDFSMEIWINRASQIGIVLLVALVTLRQIMTLSDNSLLSTRLAQLLRTSQSLAAPLNLDGVISTMTREVKGLFGQNFVGIVIWDRNNRNNTRLYASPHGAAAPSGSVITLPPDFELAFVDRQSILVQQHASDEFNEPHATPIWSLIDMLKRETATPPGMAGWIIAPLFVQEELAGLVCVAHKLANQYTVEHLNLLAAFAQHAGTALTNAMLRKRETAAAAAAERSRLARELHDSVSQALYGISLGSRSARSLIAMDTKRAAESMDFVLDLTEGALSEMRALIFELRPETLAIEGLAAALKKQTEALCRRHSLDARVSVSGGEPSLPIEAKEALYRLAVEAVQNTIKHAHASRVDIHLDSALGTRITCLEIKDNGVGFDSTAQFKGHLGLISMRERADQIGAQFSIASTPGVGTLIRAEVPNLN